MRTFKLESLWNLCVPIKCESNGVSFTRVDLIFNFLSDWIYLPRRGSVTHPLDCVLNWFAHLLVGNGESEWANVCRQFVLVLIAREFIEFDISLSDESSERSILGNSVNSEWRKGDEESEEVERNYQGLEIREIHRVFQRQRLVHVWEVWLQVDFDVLNESNSIKSNQW